MLQSVTEVCGVSLIESIKRTCDGKSNLFIHFHDASVTKVFLSSTDEVKEDVDDKKCM